VTIQDIGVRSGEAFTVFYGSLDKQFTTVEVLEVSKQLGISQATAFGWLRKLISGGHIVRTRHGEYKKVTNGN
jgi:CTP-dependent riboflavin kinase